MRIPRFTGTALAVGLLLSACSGAGSDAERAAGESPAAPSPSRSDGLADTAPDGSAIPDGTWAMTKTTADARRLGIPKRLDVELFGKDGKSRLALRIEGSEWAHFVEDKDDTMALGDQGTGGYDEDGNWVTTSHSEGCPGCVATLEWSVEGDSLTVAFLDVETTSEPLDHQIARLAVEGTYTLE
jgi:hypothetical protein